MYRDNLKGVHDRIDQLEKELEEIKMGGLHIKGYNFNKYDVISVVSLLVLCGGFVWAALDMISKSV